MSSRTAAADDVTCRGAASYFQSQNGTVTPLILDLDNFTSWPLDPCNWLREAAEIA